MTAGVDYDPQEQGLDVVARRFGRSRRWLQDLIARPRFRFHHYVGRSPRWDERQYQALRREVDQAARERDYLPAPRSSHATGPSTLPVGPTPGDAEAACEAVQRFLRGRTSGALLPRAPRRTARPAIAAGEIDKSMPTTGEEAEAPFGAGAPSSPARQVVEPVIGAAAIAARLGILVKHFYRLRAPDKRTKMKPAQMPVRHSPLGLIADGPTLEDWWLAYLCGEAD